MGNVQHTPRGVPTRGSTVVTALTVLAVVALAACGSDDEGGLGTTKVSVVGACKALDAWPKTHGHSATPSEVDEWFQTIPNGKERAAAIDEVGAYCPHYMPGVTTLPDRPLAPQP